MRIIDSLHQYLSGKSKQFVRTQLTQKQLHDNQSLVANWHIINSQYLAEYKQTVYKSEVSLCNDTFARIAIQRSLAKTNGPK